MSRSAVACAWLLAAAAAAALAALSAAQESYSDRFDGLDLDALLGDASRVDAILACFLAQADDSCDEMGRRVKAVLAEVLSTDCAKCTARQKTGLPKTARFLARERPDAWERLQAKFDPARAYAAAHPDLFQ